MARARSACRPATAGERFWEERYEDINAFEQHLARNGTMIVKFFLHVSKEEQKRRFLARLDTPGQELEVLRGRPRRAGALGRLHGRLRGRDHRDVDDWAPWYVIPADHKRVTQAWSRTILVDTITALDLEWPTVSDKDREDNAKARQALEAEA